VSDHIFRDDHVVVHLSVVDLEFETDEAGEDGGGSGLCADGLNLLSWFRSNDGEALLRG
jgi:hypothetical protein